MKATLPSGIILEGDVEELSEFIQEKPVRIPGLVRKRRKPRIAWFPPEKGPKGLGPNVKRVLSLFEGQPERVTKQQVLDHLGWTRKEWGHGPGWSLRKQVQKRLGYQWDDPSKSFIKFGKVSKHYAPMINKRDWTTKGAKTSRFYNVSPSRARQIEQVTTPTSPDVTETFVRHFKNHKISVDSAFFTALADALKENSEQRTRAFLRQFVDEEQYLTVFLPFLAKYGEQFKTRFDITKNIVIGTHGVRLA